MIDNDRKEYLEYQYSLLVDKDQRSAIHHLTSVAKIAEKIYTTRQCKGHILSKINFDYINPKKLETISLFHSIYPDIIKNEQDWDYVISLLDDDVIEQSLLYMKRCSFDCVEEIDESLLSNTSFHYYTIVRLADIRLHSDILMDKELLSFPDLERLNKLKKEYNKILNIIK